MQFADIVLSHYGWEGVALAALLLVLLCVQSYYYVCVYGRIPTYKNNRRPAVLAEEPALSVVIPMFSEDYGVVEERLPLILAQEYRDFEVVLVYVGADSDFYEDLVRLRLTFPQVFVTKIQLDPRFPISRKMALNVGIKSAHNEHLVFSSTDVVPGTDRWLSLMAKGFSKGQIVLGYCGLERGRGLRNYLMRTWRMMHSADWLGRAVGRRPNRGKIQKKQVELIIHLNSASPYPTLVCGDFNSLPSSYVYQTVKGEKLNDGFQTCGHGYMYTIRYFKHLLRIDYILHSSEFQGVDYFSPDLEYSDHNPVVMRMRL